MLYPEDDERVVVLETGRDVVSLLYRDGRCPQWIDISAVRVGDAFTELQLLCCGRFTNDGNKMYDTRRGTGPFGIKSPVFPFGYEEDSKFSLPQIDL